MKTRLKELREDNDKKQKEIALYLKVAENTYNQYENDKRSLPIDYLTKLAFFYNTTTDYILRDNKSIFALSSIERKIKNSTILKCYFSKFLFCAMLKFKKNIFIS